MLALIALLCGLGGAIWIAIIAFQEGDVVWGVCSIIFSGIAAPIYGFMNFDICRIPTILCVIGFGARVALRLGGMDG